jgi:hypothetical protein
MFSQMPAYCYMLIALIASIGGLTAMLHIAANKGQVVTQTVEHIHDKLLPKLKSTQADAIPPMQHDAMAQSRFLSPHKSVGQISSNHTLDPDSDADSARGEANGSIAPGVLFVKNIKVGGETFGMMLRDYAYRHGWPVLLHKACIEKQVDPYSCECQEMNKNFLDKKDLPPPPHPSKRYAAFFTHMHYEPRVLQDYMVPGSLKLTIIRHPLHVLRSAHVMAAHQAVHQNWIKDSFCQDLAHDGNAWRAGCKNLMSGRDSFLDYLDEGAFQELKALLEQPQENVHTQAMAVIDRTTKHLETFIIGLQEDYAASMLMFQHALGWSRGDILHLDDDGHAHRFNSPEAQKAKESWGFGTQDGEEILEQLRGGIFFYIELLYKRVVALHQKQLRQIVGDQTTVHKEVEIYRKQRQRYSECMIHGNMFSCQPKVARAELHVRCAQIALESA